VRENASQYYFRFRLGSAPNPQRPKPMGKKFIYSSESIANFQHFKRWPTCSRRVLRPVKNRISILLPVSAKERTKPDTAKVIAQYRLPVLTDIMLHVGGRWLISVRSLNHSCVYLFILYYLLSYLFI